MAIKIDQIPSELKDIKAKAKAARNMPELQAAVEDLIVLHEKLEQVIERLQTDLRNSLGKFK